MRVKKLFCEAFRILPQKTNRERMDYRRLYRMITYSIWGLLFLSTLLWAFSIVKAGRQGYPLITRGGILLIAFPLVRAAVMMGLNRTARRRGDDEPFTKGEIW